MSGFRAWPMRTGAACRLRLRALAVLGACLAVAACALPTGILGPTPTPTRTPVPAPKVRFTADWSKGLSGWQATPGWTVTNGALESSDADGLSLTIPYQPTAHTYTVEMDLQVLSVARDGGFFIFDVPTANGADGYTAGLTHLLLPGPQRFGAHPVIRTTINPLDDQNTNTSERAQTDFEPGGGVRTYQIKVDSPIVSIYVDDRFWVLAGATNNKLIATGPLVLEVSGAKVRISGMRVLE